MVSVCESLHTAVRLREGQAPTNGSLSQFEGRQPLFSLRGSVGLVVVVVGKTGSKQACQGQARGSKQVHQQSKPTRYLQVEYSAAVVGTSRADLEGVSGSALVVICNKYKPSGGQRLPSKQGDCSSSCVAKTVRSSGTAT